MCWSSQNISEYKKRHNNLKTLCYKLQVLQWYVNYLRVPFVRQVDFLISLPTHQKLTHSYGGPAQTTIPMCQYLKSWDWDWKICFSYKKNL